MIWEFCTMNHNHTHFPFSRSSILLHLFPHQKGKKNPKANLCCLCIHQSMIKLLVTSPLKITESLIDRKAEGGATDNLIKMQTYSFVLTLLTQDDRLTDFLFYLFISFFKTLSGPLFYQGSVEFQFIPNGLKWKTLIS